MPDVSEAIRRLVELSLDADTSGDKDEEEAKGLMYIVGCVGELHILMPFGS